MNSFNNFDPRELEVSTRYRDVNYVDNEKNKETMERIFFNKYHSDVIETLNWLPAMMYSFTDLFSLNFCRLFEEVLPTYLF